MSESITPEKFQIDRDILTSRLTAINTPLEERIAVSRALFLAERKKEIFDSSDKDSKGRPVRYFRLATYQELGAILNSDGKRPLQNPAAVESFLLKTKEIQRTLKNFLVNEGLFESLQTDFEELLSNFTLENLQRFVLHKLPRIKLFKLHISDFADYVGATGLNSLSVGAPYQPPYNPSEKRGRHQEGLPAVEFAIPSEEVFVHPLFKTMNLEMEKEVNTLTIKPEWIVDVYNGTEDFAERFIKDKQSVLYSGFEEMRKADKIILDYISDASIWDILQRWKRQESIADLLPVNKIEDIDENNPKLQRPLLSS